MRRILLSLLLSASSGLLACDQMSTESKTPPTTNPPPTNTTHSTLAPKNIINAPVAAPRNDVPGSFADMVAKTRPSVVNIYTRKAVRTNRYIINPKRGLVPEKRLSESLGSGFLVDASGFVLTNFHVIEKATDIEVRLLDERRFRAKVVGTDPKTDVALLLLEGAKDLPAVALGDSERLRVGDWVVAIGNPLGLTSTVTAGIASAIGRKSLPIGGDLRFQDFIQTDASINPGNSGGPLFNVSGLVIGINSAISPDGQGLGFAIPINMVKEILPRLKQGGKVKRSWLGIYVDNVPSGLRRQIGLADEQGVLVRRVVKGGPSHAAGLQPGDVILTLNSKPVKDPDALAWLAGNIGIGTVTPASVQRGSEKLELSIKMGLQPD